MPPGLVSIQKRLMVTLAWRPLGRAHHAPVLRRAREREHARDGNGRAALGAAVYAVPAAGMFGPLRHRDSGSCKNSRRTDRSISANVRGQTYRGGGECQENFCDKETRGQGGRQGDKGTRGPEHGVTLSPTRPLVSSLPGVQF